MSEVNPDALNTLTAEAVRNVLANGRWSDIPVLANIVATMGIDELKREQERQEADALAADNLSAERVNVDDFMDGEGWSSDVIYGWRLILEFSQTPAIVYFPREPDYPTIKAFARAAGMPVNKVKKEQRPDG